MPRDKSDTSTSKHHDPSEVQSPGQGPDPALVGPAVGDGNARTSKLTGTGTDGSHSAVFGLTPDGHKHDETDSTTTAPKPAHSKETSLSQGDSSNDTSSRAPAGEGVKDQMHKVEADSGDKGLERTDPAPGGSSGAASDGKPGAGVSGPSMGSGKVGEDV